MATWRLQIVVECKKNKYIFLCFLDVTEEYWVVEVKLLRSLEILSLEFSVAGLWKHKMIFTTKF
jgi:hypothetical protein